MRPLSATYARRPRLVKTIISPRVQGTVPCRPSSSHGDKSQKGRSIFALFKIYSCPLTWRRSFRGFAEGGRPPECPACNDNGSSRTSDTII
ncbi:Uncharacterized protein HZ326_0051 [Fusarium oxysporum f. sp. albedinis]|nr:Uncharacterized protein HZ326_0051 [Fusarium oxysporum f. sp. albedinis]